MDDLLFSTKPLVETERTEGPLKASMVETERKLIWCASCAEAVAWAAAKIRAEVFIMLHSGRWIR